MNISSKVQSDILNFLNWKPREQVLFAKRDNLLFNNQVMIMEWLSANIDFLS